MAKPSKPRALETSTPQEFPAVPPRDLHPTSDIRFVMRDIGALTAKVDRLIEDTSKMSSKIGDLSEKIDKFETAMRVIISFVVIIGASVTYFFGDFLKATVSQAVKAAIVETTRSNR